MSILIVGINHHAAPVELREKVAAAYAAFCARAGIRLRAGRSSAFRSGTRARICKLSRRDLASPHPSGQSRAQGSRRAALGGAGDRFRQS